MSDYMKLLKNWQTISGFLGKIVDPKARKMYHDTLLLKAIEKWGFNPEKIGDNSLAVKPELDEFETELLEAINAKQTYGVDIRTEKRKKTQRETHIRMVKFIDQGGTLKDIPDDIRSENIVKLYYDCLMEYGDTLMVDADRVFGVAL